MNVEQQRAIAKQVEQQSKMDRVQQKMDALVDYLTERGLKPKEIIHTLALMNEYDSAFQDAIAQDESEPGLDDEGAYAYRNEVENERY